METMETTMEPCAGLPTRDDGAGGQGRGEISARTAIHRHDIISTMGEHREVSNESNQSSRRLWLLCQVGLEWDR